jgi:ribonuclease HII
MSQPDIFEERCLEAGKTCANPETPQRKRRKNSKYVQIEERLWASGFKSIAGVDEVGRGPLAGPVVACACILPQGKRFKRVKDSKQLTSEERAEIYLELVANSEIHWAIATCDHEIIDKINILRASLLAMKYALDKLALVLQPDFVLVDGRDCPPLHIPHQAIIKGDTLSQSIAAASIIAKVTRDTMMEEFHKQWPEYGFEDHKGYGTKAHLQAINEFGLSPIHRKSFAPIARHIDPNQPQLF